MPGPEVPDRLARAQALHRSGRLQEAAAAYRAALADAPEDDRLHEWYGMLCLQCGQGDAALTHLQTATRLRPGVAAYFENLAGAAMQLGRIPVADGAFRAALRLNPCAAELRRAYVRMLLQSGQPGVAMDVLEPLVHADPYLNAHCRNPDSVPTQEARHRIVVENCRHICARFPEYAPAQYAMACSLLVLGDMSGAVAAAEAAIHINPTLPVYYHVAMEAGSASQKAAAVTALEKLKAHAGQMPRDGLAMLHFLLAKAYDRAGRYDEAFAEMQAGNMLKRALIQYDGAAAVAEMQQIAGMFPADVCCAGRGVSPLAGGPRQAGGPRPVFVVGMYRSGTSLIEQILASHPDVYGAGEITLMPEVLAEAGVRDPAGMHDADFARIGARYLERLRTLAPDSRVIVDKLPDNFLRLGWIVRALPGARILHIRRDPLDCCFSCYAHMFAGNIGYAYDLAELGQYYKACQGLMAHWANALPGDAMLTLQYESVVDSPADSIREMLDFCGLSWNQACLSFEKTPRAVATASVSEVRQPIFRHSVGRSKPYLSRMQPLIGSLS